jgi:hypothetical protein
VVAGSQLFLIREGLIGHALRLRGADVSFLLCDEFLPACDARTVDHGPHRCGDCFAAGARRYDWLGLPTVRAGGFVPPGARDRLRERSRECPADAIFKQEYEGHRVGAYAYSSTLRHFLACEADLGDPRLAAKARDYLHAGMLMVEAVRGALDRLRPDRVFTSHGVYVSWAPLLEEARRRSVPVITYGGSFRRDTLRFYRDAAVAPFPDGAWPRYRDRPLSPAQERQVDEYLPARRTQEVEQVPLVPDEGASDPALERWLAAPRAGKLFGLFTNIAWDAAAFATRAVFPSMFAWVEATVRHFGERPQHRLLIKAHPAELRGAETTPPEQRVGAFLRRRFPRLPANVFFLGPECAISPYRLYGHLDAGLTHLSTVSLEMALLGLSVLTSGCAGLYSGHGFTLDPATQDEYFARLEGLMSGAEGFRPDVPMARRYLHFRFFREAIPFELIETAGWSVRRLRVGSLAELLPGRNPHLDLICDGILHGRDLVLPD